MITSDGLELKTTIWSVENAKANIFLIHGYAEHSGRYEHVADFLNKNNINLYGIDLRGHGESEGKQAYINSFKQFTDDIDIWLNQYADLKVPAFIYGHSMGGLVATAYLQEYVCPLSNLSGLLLTAPAFMPKKDLAPTLIKFSSYIGKYFPKLKTIQLDPRLVSSDPVEVKKYIDDPLVYSGKWYARTASELIAKMKDVQKNASSFNYPVFVAHGSKDRLAEIEGSQKFFKNIVSTDKTFHIEKDAFHELVNEPTKLDIMNMMLSWINSRL